MLFFALFVSCCPVHSHLVLSLLHLQRAFETSVPKLFLLDELNHYGFVFVFLGHLPLSKGHVQLDLVDIRDDPKLVP